MLFKQKKKDKPDCLVYVLNGSAPPKLRYFNQRNQKKVRTIIMDSNGDPANKDNIDYLISTNALDDNIYAKVLITSEHQLEYIESNKKIKEWYTKHIDQFIVTQFKFDDYDYISTPSALSNKKIMHEFFKKHKHPTYGSIVSHAKLMTGDSYNKLSNKEKQNYVVKSAYGSGSEGALLSPKKVKAKEEYIVEKVIKSSPTVDFFVCTTLVTPNKKHNNDISILITSEKHKEFVDTGYPHTHADFSRYNSIKELMKWIADELGVTSGLFETEIAYDFKKNTFYLIDLNPRWSTDHDCIKEKFGKIVGKRFDMLTHAYFKKPFYKIVERFLSFKPAYVGPLLFYASTFIERKTSTKTWKII